MPWRRRRSEYHLLAIQNNPCQERWLNRESVLQVCALGRTRTTWATEKRLVIVGTYAA
jgi:hypothetical protein